MSPVVACAWFTVIGAVNCGVKLTKPGGSGGSIVTLYCPTGALGMM